MSKLFTFIIVFNPSVSFHHLLLFQEKQKNLLVNLAVEISDVLSSRWHTL